MKHLKHVPWWVLVGLSLLFTWGLWLGSKWYLQDWFTDWLKYPAKFSSLTATVLMTWTMIFSTRSKWLEDLVDGLDKVYQAHKLLGIYTLLAILIHPLALALTRWPDPAMTLAYLGLQTVNNNLYNLGHNVGLAALLGMLILISLSLIKHIPYHWWKLSHQWFGVVYALVAVHIVLVDADISAYPLLRIWMYALLLAGLGSFVYIRFLYRFLSPKYAYLVEDVEMQGDVLEIWLKPSGKLMQHKPSQFAYLSFQAEGISDEPHPYSIASAPNPEGRLKFGIKQLGDHTRTLTALKPGDQVTVTGPYGRFSEKFLLAHKDCVFIGGGIGITPFLGMWNLALHSFEREAEETPQSLQSFHPKQVSTWKSPRVHLFYCVNSKREASFDNDIQHAAILSQHAGNKHHTSRGHSYELYETDRMSYLTAQYVWDKVGGLQDKHIFLCGPKPMVNALIRQMQDLGVKPGQISLEEFQFLGKPRRWLPWRLHRPYVSKSKA